MMKRIACFLFTLIICLGMFRMDCLAANVNPDPSCSLTLSYSSNGVSFPNLEIEIYRVAAEKNGMYALVEPFSTYPIKIHGITSQQEWKDTAQTVKSYVNANQITAYRSQKTDITGRVYFKNLETGLYMVKGVIAQNMGESVEFLDFMIYLPMLTNGSYNYNVSAKPKHIEYIPPVRHTVFKLWRDGGVTEQRPEAIYVDILKDGVVQESIALNHDNSWSYSWETENSDGVWSVMEKDAPEGYDVTITNTQTIFMITNTYVPTTPEEPEDPDKPNPPDKPDKPDKPEEPEDSEDEEEPDTPSIVVPPSVAAPKTGDTVPLLLYAMILCISGFGLIIFSVLKLRERKDEKKR